MIYRTIVWQTLDEPAMELLHFSITSDGFLANGVVVGIVDSTPFQLEYEAHISTEFQIQRIDLDLSTTNNALWTDVRLYTEAHGKWVISKDGEIDWLRGCMDVDLMGSAFTNTLPIRRLTWEVGVAQEIKVAYIAVPTLELSPMRQRYTLLAEHEGGEHTFRYESLSDAGETTYQADLRVDADGLVITYEGLFRRVYPPVA